MMSWVDKFLEMPELMKVPEFGKTDDLAEAATSTIWKGTSTRSCTTSSRRSIDAGRGRCAAGSPKHAERLWNAGQCFPEPRHPGRSGA